MEQSTKQVPRRHDSIEEDNLADDESTTASGGTNQDLPDDFPETEAGLDQELRKEEIRKKQGARHNRAEAKLQNPRTA